MIERLLIANRGEIARRVMRTCRRLGVETVAVFSNADVGAAFVADADLSVPIGGDAPADSYLRIEAIIEAARRTGADAVHPGYGFLAESAPFARAVAEAGLTFVGPSAEAIDAMGSKLEAKRRMADAGVPLLPSAELTDLDEASAAAAASDVGYPLLIKASAGGGGRGMRIVDAPDGLAEAVTGAAREATSAFGDGTIYAERYVSPSRHVEVQIFGDGSGRVVHFGERECSIQRRHQKIIEEAPSPSLDERTRAELHAAAVRAGEAIGYTNAGTVEFLLAPPGADGRPELFFLEVNTRLQVEHPVTEAIFGFDLVELQLGVASGGSVPEQSAIGPPQGHAVEARLYAEDPTADFRPSTGTVRAFRVPDGVRLDSAIDPGPGPDAASAAPDPNEPVAAAGEVSQFYDPMIAKVIAHGPDRTVATRRLASALAGTVVDGIATNRELLVRTLRHPEYENRGDSGFLERNDPVELGRPLLEGDDLAMAAGAAALALQASNRIGDRHTAGVASGFRNVVTSGQRVGLSVGERIVEVEYRFERGRLAALAVDGRSLIDPVVYGASVTSVDLAVDGIRRLFEVGIGPVSVSVVGPAGSVVFGREPRFVEPTEQTEPGSTVATMPGTIVSVAVTVGDSVEAGDVLLVMEAMKMELTVSATSAGAVSAVSVAAGETVDAGAVLVVVDEVEV
jgi:acetyl/propionyl-CoA carboxylase alpha subunit